MGVRQGARFELPHDLAVRLDPLDAPVEVPPTLKLADAAVVALLMRAEAGVELVLIERSHALRTARLRARPETTAFLAMVHYRLGNEEEAREHLDSLRGLMQIAALQAKKSAITFFQEAEALLGYPYRISGRVVYGQQLGRQIGAPTANLLLPRMPAWLMQ